MLKKRRPKKLVAEINVVPYIDVMLVLLVIFIVTAPLLQQGVAVDLPQASAKSLPPSEKEPIIVSVDKTGNFYLNISESPQLPIAKEALTTRVMAELKLMPERKVLVKADGSVNYAKVIGAMVVLQHAGAPSVGLVTQDDAPSSNSKTAAKQSSSSSHV